MALRSVQNLRETREQAAQPALFSLLYIFNLDKGRSEGRPPNFFPETYFFGKYFRKGE